MLLRRFIVSFLPNRPFNVAIFIILSFCYTIFFVITIFTPLMSVNISFLDKESNILDIVLSLYQKGYYFIGMIIIIIIILIPSSRILSMLYLSKCLFHKNFTFFLSFYRYVKSTVEVSGLDILFVSLIVAYYKLKDLVDIDFKYGFLSFFILFIIDILMYIELEKFDYKVLVEINNVHHM